MQHEKAGREILDVRDNGLIETDRSAAIPTGEMRMATVWFAVMGEFKMPDAVSQIGIVNNIMLEQKQQSPIDRGLIHRARRHPLKNLFTGQRTVRFQKNTENLQTGSGFPQPVFIQQLCSFLEVFVRH